MGKESGGDTTTSTEPWWAAQGHLEEIFRRAGGTRDSSGRLTGGLVDEPLSLAGMTPEQRQAAFRGITGENTVAASRRLGVPIHSTIASGGITPFTQGERSAMDLARQEAGQERAFGRGWTERTGRGTELAQNPWTDETATGAGQFLSPETNPWLRQTYEAAAEPLMESFQERILPQLRSQFTMSGQSAGGPGEQFEAETASRGLTRSLSDLSAGIYGPAYQMERQLMEQALGRQQQAYGDERQFQEAAIARMPQMALMEQQEALRRMQAMQGVGSAERGLAQQYAGLVSGQQMEPWQQIQNYSQAIQPGLQGFSESSQPYYSNPLMGAAGMIATGAGAGSLIPGFGAPLGALAGGLLSLPGFF